jgi:hypothetical protein
MTRESSEKQTQTCAQTTGASLLDNALTDYVLDKKENKRPGTQFFEACHKSLSLASGLSSATLRADIASHPLSHSLQSLEAHLPKATIKQLGEAKTQLVKLADTRIEKYGIAFMKTANKCPLTTLESVSVYDTNIRSKGQLQAHELPATWNENLRPFRPYCKPDHLRLAPKVNSISVLQEMVLGSTYHSGFSLSDLESDRETLKLLYQNPYLSRDKEVMQRAVKLDMAIYSAESAAIYKPALGARVFRSSIAQFAIAATVNATMDNTAFADRYSDLNTIGADTIAPLILASEASPWLKLSTMIFSHAAAKYFAPKKSYWR